MPSRVIKINWLSECRIALFYKAGGMCDYSGNDIFSFVQLQPWVRKDLLRGLAIVWDGLAA